jgi:hypothetical protein
MPALSNDITVTINSFAAQPMENILRRCSRPLLQEQGA